MGVSTPPLVPRFSITRSSCRMLLMAPTFFCAIQGLMRKRSSGFYSLMTVFKTDSAGEICFSKAC